MKKFLFTLIGLYCILMFANSQSISGTWIFNNGNFPLTMLLLDNGTGEFQGMPIKHSIKEGKLFIDDGYQPISYTYTVSNISLTLSDGGLPLPITFTRAGADSENTTSDNQNLMPANNASNSSYTQQSENTTDMAGNISNQSTGGSGKDFPGIWEGQQGKIVFYPDGMLLYNGTSYQYSASGNSIIITGNDGSTNFTYNLSGIQLTLTQSANSAQYSKTSSLKPDVIDPQLVGKWCIMSSSYNSYSGGGSSSEECITLNANGTYSYNFSSSRSAYSADQSSYGGTSNQDSDQGSWKTDGLTIISVSQTTGKTTRYSLVKENAQNGDATIVLGGRKFVTAYNRPGW